MLSSLQQSKSCSLGRCGPCFRISHTPWLSPVVKIVWRRAIASGAVLSSVSYLPPVLLWLHLFAVSGAVVIEAGWIGRRPDVCFLFWFESFIYTPLHAARRAMAAAVPLPSRGQRRIFKTGIPKVLPRTSLRGYGGVSLFSFSP